MASSSHGGLDLSGQHYVRPIGLSHSVVPGLPWPSPEEPELVKAHEATLDQFLDAPVQYQVPLYRRTYSWGENQLSQLQNDLITVADQFADGRSVSAYFLGSMLLISIPPISRPYSVRKNVCTVP